MKKQVAIELIIEFAMVLLGLWVHRLALYVLFLVCSLAAIAKRRFSFRTLWEVAIYSIMLPDNYSTIVLMAIPAILTLLKRNVVNRLRMPKVLWFAYILLVVAVVSTLLHSVPVVNVVLAIIYSSSAAFALVIIGKGGVLTALSNCRYALLRLARIEIIATFFNFIMLLMGKKTGDDWSTGTLGSGQQAQAFLLFALFSLLMLAYSIHSKKSKRKFLIMAIMGTFCALSTKCWAQLGVTVVFVILGYVTITDKKTAKRIFAVLALSVVLIVGLGRAAMKSNIGGQVLRIATDKSYRAYRAAKLDVYGQTFFEIPKKDPIFLLIGNGVGWYSSRSALTCTGAYVPWYGKLFPKTMSAYTEKYIYPGLLRAYHHSSTDYGSVIARPYSSIITVMGEVGVFGLTLGIYLFVKIAKKFGGAARVMLFAWLASCFIENYLEYSKIVLFMMICLYLVNELEKAETPTKLSVVI